MAIKTFTSGSVLTAADTNEYLGNAGLVYVKSQTVGTAVASVTVSAAFSSTYDSYKIIYTGASAGSGVVTMTLGASTTTYSSLLLYGNTYALPTPTGLGGSAGALWNFVGYVDANVTTVSIDVFSPNLARYTTFTAPYISLTNAGTSSGIHATAAAYTSFTLAATSLTGGTITVYGYRKA